MTKVVSDIINDSSVTGSIGLKERVLSVFVTTPLVTKICLNNFKPFALSV